MKVRGSNSATLVEDLKDGLRETERPISVVASSNQMATLVPSLLMCVCCVVDANDDVVVLNFCNSLSLPAPRSVELYGADNLFRGRGLLFVLELCV